MKKYFQITFLVCFYVVQVIPIYSQSKDTSYNNNKERKVEENIKKLDSLSKKLEKMYKKGKKNEIRKLINEIFSIIRSLKKHKISSLYVHNGRHANLTIYDKPMNQNIKFLKKAYSRKEKKSLGMPWLA